MKRSPHGWTLLEVLVSTALLAGMLLVVVESLGIVQAGSHVTLRQASLAIHQDEVLPSLRRSIAAITLDTHPRYDPGTASWTPTSDGHFVCGPAKELLPEEPEVVGDAVFYQQRNAEGQIECGGWFVRIADDRQTRPRALAGRLQPRTRFCLIRWQQPAALNPLYTASSPLRQTTPPLMDRAALYRWFREGIRQATQCHIVAEHVYALSITTEPFERCYDTRRYQWDSSAGAALASKHQMPSRLTIKLLYSTEAATERARLHNPSFMRGWLQRYDGTQDWATLIPMAHSALKLDLEASELTACPGELR